MAANWQPRLIKWPPGTPFNTVLIEPRLQWWQRNMATDVIMVRYDEPGQLRAALQRIEVVKGVSYESRVNASS